MTKLLDTTFHIHFHDVEDDPAVATLGADFGWVEILPFSIRHAYCAGEIEAHFHGQGMPRTSATPSAGIS